MPCPKSSPSLPPGREEAEPSVTWWCWAWPPQMLEFLGCGDGGCAAAQPSWEDEVGCEQVRPGGCGHSSPLSKWPMTGRQAGLSKSEEDHQPSPIPGLPMYLSICREVARPLFSLDSLFILACSAEMYSHPLTSNHGLWRNAALPFLLRFDLGSWFLFSADAFYLLRGWKVLLFLQVVLDVWEVTPVHLTTPV